MIVHCVFMEISVGPTGDGTEFRLLAIFDTQRTAEIFVKQWDNPRVRLHVQPWDVIDTIE